MIWGQAGFVESKGMSARSNQEKTLTHMLGDALKKRIRLRPNERAQADSQFAQVIEATPDFVVTMDVKGHVLYGNRAVRQMIGMSGDEDIAKLHIADIYSARSCATVLGEGVFIAILDGEWSGEAALLTRAGREIPVSQVIIAPPGADRACEFLALIARDVKEIKQAEESLREGEQFYRRITEAARVGIWVIDTENQTSFVNPQMASMLGYSENEMRGKPATSFVRCNRIAFSQLDLDDSHKLLLRRKDGAELWVSLSPSPLYNEQEQYTGTMAVVTEITETKQERVQAQSERGFP
jgi:PAS domain S-box-containing protein